MKINYQKVLILIVAFLFTFALFGCKTKYDIALSESDKTLTLKVGDVYTVTPTSGQDDATFTWTSDAESIASVNAGKVTALAPGHATITVAITEDTSIKATIDVTVSAIALTDIQISGNPILKVGETNQLSATITPSNADTTGVVWSSDDENIVTVDQTGAITGVNAGNAKVTLANADGSIKDSTNIIVDPAEATGIEISGESEIAKGYTAQLTATILPDKATGIVVWESSDETVATVDESTGVVTTLEVGEVTITATISGTEISDTFDMSVIIIEPTAIEITSEESVTTIKVPETTQLGIAYTPEKAFATVTWSSSDETIATVDQSGVVTAKGVGVVTITATAGELTNTYDFTITAAEPTSITADEASPIVVGATTQLSATVEPLGAVQSVTWASSNTSVATVDENGLVTAKAAGTTNITIAATADSTVKKVLELTVQAKDVYLTSDDSLQEELMTLADGTVIHLAAGIYTENINVDVNNLTIMSDANADVNPNTGTRGEETEFTGVITLAKNLEGFEVNGLKFTGSSAILNTTGDTGTATDTATNLNGFTFVNCIVESSLTSGNGFIAWSETDSSSCYNHDVVINNNSFKGVGAFNAGYMLYIDNPYNFTFVGNVMEDISNTALFIYDSTKGLSGEFAVVCNNTFKNIGGDAFDADWMSPLPLGNTTATIQLKNNNFENVVGTAMHFGRMNNSDTYKSFEVMYNTFTTVGTGVSFDRVHANVNIVVNYNTFTNIPSVAYFESAQISTASPSALDATKNLYLDGFGTVIALDTELLATENDAIITVDPALTSASEVPDFYYYAISIEIGEVSIYVGETATAEVTYNPADCVYKEVIWTSSDESVATVSDAGEITALKAGSVTITATYNGSESLQATLDLDIEEYTAVELRYEGSGLLETSDTLQIAATAVNVESANVTFETSDASIATVDENGLVTAVAEGNFTITATDATSGKMATIDLTVKDMTSASELLKLLAEGNQGVIYNSNIQYVGFESGYQYADNIRMNIYGSANLYYAAALPTINETHQINLDTAQNITKDDIMESVKYITVHDTATAAPSGSAAAMAAYCASSSNAAASWHYSVGNDGIYHQLADNHAAWHAGDGGDNQMCSIDTGVTALDSNEKPEITVSEDGFFVIAGVKSTYAAPKVPLAEGGERLATTADLTPTGMITVIGDNGHYFMNTYYNNTYKVIANYGGANTIAIESCMNYGSDVYLTWQYLAKLVAKLEIENDLSSQRVCFHNTLSGKCCPNTMIHEGMLEYFESMIDIEWEIAKNYSDYTITFASSNTAVLDNSGRVVGDGPELTTSVPYTVTVTKDGVSESMTLNTVIIGQRAKDAMQTEPSVDPYTGKYESNI
ncbi:MAG: Ig-like domain-containing protein [Bacilli bacterium]